MTAALLTGASILMDQALSPGHSASVGINQFTSLCSQPPTPTEYDAELKALLKPRINCSISVQCLRESRPVRFRVSRSLSNRLRLCAGSGAPVKAAETPGSQAAPRGGAESDFAALPPSLPNCSRVIAVLILACSNADRGLEFNCLINVNSRHYLDDQKPSIPP